MTPDAFAFSVQRAAELIKHARHAVALTGAGISTPSGIPDFRSASTGLWSQNDPMRVASLSAFRYRPEAFFDWLRPLAEKMLAAAPNPAHDALAQLEEKGFLKALATQNIDDLHQRAGSQKVIELHGSMNTLTCPACRHQDPLRDHSQAFISQVDIPVCPQCGAVMKPDVVLFEELLPAKAWNDAERHFSQADLVLVVGSSLEVHPAAQLPYLAVDNGARLIINNYTPTPLDAQAELLLPYDVAEALPAIVRAL